MRPEENGTIWQQTIYSARVIFLIMNMDRTTMHYVGFLKR
jgi:hypothetical protein